MRRRFWERWTTGGHEAPRAVCGRLAAVILIALAIPALSLEFGNGALRQFPEGNETTVGTELATNQVAPGESAPTLIVADFKSAVASPPTRRHCRAI